MILVTISESSFVAPLFRLLLFFGAPTIVFRHLDLIRMFAREGPMPPFVFCDPLAREKTQKVLNRNFYA